MKLNPLTTDMNKAAIIRKIKRLDENQFIILEDAIFSILSCCSIRLQNGIRNTGIREICTSYIFEEPIEFLKIKNFGRKSLLELTPLIPVIQNKIREILMSIDSTDQEDIECSDEENNDSETLNNVTPTPIVQQISPDCLTLIDGHYKKLCKQMSVRTRKALHKISIIEFITRFIENQEDVINLNQIGRKSIPEIQHIITIIKDEIEFILNEGKDKREKYINFKILASKVAPYDDDYVQNEIIKNGHAPILYILSKHFHSQASTLNGDIIEHLIRVFKNEIFLSRNQIADRHNKTPERVRQLCCALTRCFVDFVFKGNIKGNLIPFFKKLLYESNLWLYLYEKVSDRLFISEHDIEDLILSENSDLDNRFVLHLLSKQFEEYFTLIPSKQDDNENKCLKPFYLISRRISDIFDFKRFEEKLDDLIESVTENRSFTIKELVYQEFPDAWKIFKPEYINEIESIISHILLEDYGLFPVNDDYYTIECKKRVRVCDVLFRILQNAGEPLTINEIYHEYCQMYPNRYTEAEQLRPALLYDDRISAVGRQGVYALVEWDHVKFGSIRDLIVEYLSKFDKPQHISDILNYVSTYYDTNDKNLRSTMGSGRQFIAFNGGYYGLSDRIYDNSFIETEDARKSFESRLMSLEAFLVKEGHFPFSSSEDEEEESLHHWFRRMDENKLSESQKEDYLNVIEKYAHLPQDKRTYRWFTKCKKYGEFIHEMGRKPYSRKSEEIELYEWFAKASRDFNDGSLSIEQERKFVELCNLL